MRLYDVVIVGGGPAGVSCAISAHNSHPDKSVAVIRNVPTALIPCGIPYVLHSLDSVDQDILPDTLLENIGADLIIDEVVSGNGNKTLQLKSGEEIKYDKLVLATGSQPVKPPIDGNDKEGVFFITKDREYLGELRDAAKSANGAVIIGGGYIGVEIADELLKEGKETTIVEMRDHLLPNSMDPEFGNKAQEILEAAGASVKLNTRAKAILGDREVRGVDLGSGETVRSEIVIISAGAQPNTDLAKTLGLAVDPRHGVLVNEYCRTSHPDIFAVGDCAAKRDFFTGELSGVMLASTAMSEGRLAGSNLFEIKVIRRFAGVLGSFSTKIGNTAFGTSGITEAKANDLGIDYVVGEATTPDRHPGKLPGASPLHLKLIFSRYCHTLLGAQMHGGDSVGELVNMVSVMILKKMSDMEIDTIQVGTHPLLTSSPIAYPVITATVDAITKWYQPT